MEVALAGGGGDPARQAQVTSPQGVGGNEALGGRARWRGVVVAWGVVSAGSGVGGVIGVDAVQPAEATGPAGHVVGDHVEGKPGGVGPKARGVQAE